MESDRQENFERINKLIPELKNINSLDNFQKGLYCDAQDETKAWCTAEITDRVDDKIKIHFEGWSSKFDDIVTIRSKKVNHFRRYTKCYSGQKGVSYRTLLINPEEFQSIRNLIAEVRDTNFACLKDALEATQVLRGKIFTYIDIYMTSPYSNNNPSVFIPQVVDMLYDYIDLAVLYLRYVKDNLHLAEVHDKYPDLFLLDQKLAIFASYNEIIFTLVRIFAHDDRVNVFYKVYIVY